MTKSEIERFIIEMVINDLKRNGPIAHVLETFLLPRMRGADAQGKNQPMAPRQLLRPFSQSCQSSRNNE